MELTVNFPNLQFVLLKIEKSVISNYSKRLIIIIARVDNKKETISLNFCFLFFLDYESLNRMIYL